MCHWLAGIISEWCEERMPMEQTRKITIRYGMEVFLELLWKLIGMILIGMVVRKKELYFLSIFSFCLLRLWIGGKHFCSSVFCFGFMVFVGCCPAYFCGIDVIPVIFGEFLLAISFIIVEKCGLFGQAYLSIDSKKMRKSCAYILLLLYMFWILLIKIPGGRDAILFGTGIEMMLVIWERMELKNDKRKKEYREKNFGCNC